MLRTAFPEITVVSWVPSLDTRTIPLVLVRRVGGTAIDPAWLDRAHVEVTAFDHDLIAAEDLLLDIRITLTDAVDHQTTIAGACLHSLRELSGPTPIPSHMHEVQGVQATFAFTIRAT